MGLLLDDPRVINKPIPIPGWVRGRPECFSLKMIHVQVSNYRAYQSSLSCAFNLFIKLVMKEELCVMQKEPQKFNDALYW